MRNSTANFCFIFVLKQIDNSFHAFEIIFSALVFGFVFPIYSNILILFSELHKFIRQKNNLLGNHPSTSLSHAKQFYLCQCQVLTTFEESLYGDLSSWLSQIHQGTSLVSLPLHHLWDTSQ